MDTEDLEKLLQNLNDAQDAIDRNKEIIRLHGVDVDEDEDDEDEET